MSQRADKGKPIPSSFFFLGQRFFIVFVEMLLPVTLTIGVAPSLPAGSIMSFFLGPRFFIVFVEMSLPVTLTIGAAPSLPAGSGMSFFLGCRFLTILAGSSKGSSMLGSTLRSGILNVTPLIDLNFRRGFLTFRPFARLALAFLVGANTLPSGTASGAHGFFLGFGKRSSVIGLTMRL